MPARPPAAPPGGRFQFSDPETQDEFDKASKLPARSIGDKLAEAFDSAWHKLSRTYEHLPRTGEFEPARFELKKLEKMKAVSLERTMRDVADLTKDFSKDQAYNFRVAVILNDLKATADEGMEVPFYAGELDKLDKDHAEINAQVARDPVLKEAMRKRDKLWRDLTSDYKRAAVEIGQAQFAERFSRPAYFHHHVLLEAKLADRERVGNGAALKTPKGRSYAQRREGSRLPISTDYAQVEARTIAQMRYDIAKMRARKAIFDHYDVMDGLKREAFRMNEAGIMDFFRSLAKGSGEHQTIPGTAERAQEDESLAGKMFRETLNKKQAIAVSRLVEMAVEGELPAVIGKRDFSDVLDALREVYYDSEKNARPASESLAKGSTQLAGNLMPRLIEYANAMLKEGDHAGAKTAAATLFKGMADKKKFIKEHLGEQYATWRTLIPDGYTAYQPDPGSVFYQAKTIPERVAAALTEDAAREIGITADQLRTVVAKGGRLKEHVIPQELADTLNLDLRTDFKQTLLGKAAKGVTKPWKLWELSSPLRFLHFRSKHISGQAEAMMVGNPQAYTELPAAIKDVAAWRKGETPSAELQAWLDRGGAGSLITEQELEALDRLKDFAKFYDTKGGLKQIPLNLWQGYWRKSRASIDVAESVMRYAAFRDFRRQMLKNANGMPDDWAASNAEEVKALKSLDDRAWKMANDLLGAYDDLSVFGQELRRTVYPFFSFQEINLKRSFRFILNSGYDPQAPGGGGGGGRNGGTGHGAGSDAGDGWDGFRFAYGLMGKAARKSPFVAWRVGRLLLRMAAFWGMFNGAWYLWHKDEEKDLPPEIRSRPHIIFGRDANGNVRYLGKLGSSMEPLEWFGLDAPQELLRDWLDHKLSTREVAEKMGKAFVSKAVGGVTPLIKTTGELIVGRKTYPNVFHPSPIRDRLQYLADSLALGTAYKLATGKPSEGWKRLLGEGFFNYVDRNANAYYEVLDAKRQFMSDHGMADTDYGGSAKSEALRNARLAMHFGDEAMAEKYMTEYFNQGGTMKGMKESLRSMDPMFGLSKAQRLEFMDTFSPEDWRNYERAVRYSREYLATPEEREQEEEQEDNHDSDTPETTDTTESAPEGEDKER